MMLATPNVRNGSKAAIRERKKSSFLHAGNCVLSSLMQRQARPPIGDCPKVTPANNCCEGEDPEFRSSDANFVTFHCGRGSSKASSLALHSPSMIPSIRSGRNRRWKAITAFCVLVTS